MARNSDSTHRPFRLAGWLRRADLIVLLALLALVTGMWVFVGIAAEVTEGGLQGLDERVLLSLRDPDDLRRPLGPGWLQQTAVDISALGGFAVLTLLILSVVCFLLLARKYGSVLLVLVATLGGWALSTGLKGFFDRPRPAVVPHLTHVGSASFPSGHSMLSAVVYLTLGALLARLVAKWSLKLYLIGVAALVAVLVGATRVYLGVHYPSDVLAGWAAGLVWAVACWLTARYLQHRGAVEKNLTPEGNNHEQTAGGDRDRG